MKYLKNKKKKTIALIATGIVVAVTGAIAIEISSNLKKIRNDKIIEEDKKILDDIKQNKIKRPNYNYGYEEDDEYNAIYGTNGDNHSGHNHD